jgi:uncharacterized protein (TIGR03437 family)
MRAFWAKSAGTLVLAVSACAQAPTITAIENNYSYIPGGLPNSAIAQGAIFIVKGANLGPGTLVSNTFPLTTSFQNVSATVTVNDTTVNLPMYYAWSDQLAFVLPSSTPLGTVTLTVTVNGQTVGSTITVVAGQFGLLNLNAQGSGPAAAEHLPDYTYVTPNNAANPGEEIVLWGSGLGASTGSDTDVVPSGGTPGTLTGPPPQVWIGGQQATVLYAGRSIYPGLDQVNVLVPTSVGLGCFVSVYVSSSSTAVSNVATIPVAPTGTRTCSDVNGVSAEDIQNFYSKPDFKLGQIYLARSQPTILNVPVTFDTGAASFADYTQVQGWQSQSAFHLPSAGSCTVNNFTGNATNAAPIDPIKGTGLDAGTMLINGSAGQQTIPKIATGYYASTLSGNTPTSPIGTPYLNPGNYTISASGGTDVDAFSVTPTLAAPTIAWTPPSTTNIGRARDLTINYTKADPNSTVVAIGISTDMNNIGAAFYCAGTPGADGSGSITIPAGILGGLPASVPASSTGGGFTVPPGFLLVGTSTTTKETTPKGLDALYLTTVNASGQPVLFQ